MKAALAKLRANALFEILHPAFASYLPEEEIQALKDKAFIIEHIDEIQKDLERRDFYEEEISLVLGAIIGDLRESRVTTAKIGQATKYAPTMLKQEAARVEEMANTPVKEGEKRW